MLRYSWPMSGGGAANLTELWQRMRDYCVGATSTRWRAKGANVCVAGGLLLSAGCGLIVLRCFRHCSITICISFRLYKISPFNSPSRSFPLNDSLQPLSQGAPSSMYRVLAPTNECLLLALNGQSTRTCICLLLDQSGQRRNLARDGLSAYDPKRTFVTSIKVSPALLDSKRNMRCP
jgi:hypothetical protein